MHLAPPSNDLVHAYLIAETVYRKRSILFLNNDLCLPVAEREILVLEHVIRGERDRLTADTCRLRQILMLLHKPYVIHYILYVLMITRKCLSLY